MLTQRLRLTRRAIDCYKLGDMLLDTGFMNAVVDELIRICEKCNTVPSHESVNHAWENIPNNSKLVSLMADFYATEMGVREFDNTVAKLPVEFVAMVARAGIRDKMVPHQMRKPARKLRCHYHKHESSWEKCTSERCRCADCSPVKESSKIWERAAWEKMVD